MVMVEGASLLVVGPEMGEALEGGLSPPVDCGEGDAGMMDRILLQIYDVLLYEDLIDEDDIEEPQRLSMNGLPIMDGGMSPPMMEDGLPLPDGGASLNSIDVCKLLEEHVCRLGRLQIRYNRAWSGDSAWIGLCAREVILDGSMCPKVLHNVDGHITLLYLGKKELPMLETVVENLEKELARIDDSPCPSARFEFTCILNQEHAKENYAWCDILVRSALHGAVHNLVNHSVKQSLPRAWLKRAFHYSVRQSQWTTLVQS